MDYRDCTKDLQSIKLFLQEYYKLEDYANREATLLVVELAKLKRFDYALHEAVIANTQRYESIFHMALDELLPGCVTKETPNDIMDVFIAQRRYIAESSQATNTDKFPPELFRRVEIAFKPESLESVPIRQIQAKHVGKLVTVRGIVIRTSDVKPQLKVACYTCDQCGYETFQNIKTQEYIPLFECESSSCKASKNFGRLTKQIRGSAFCKVQEIKLQEHSDQVPTGHIPRSVNVLAFGEQTRLCAPGDHVLISGVFMPLERTGFIRGQSLSTDTYIQAHYITRMNKTEDDELSVEPMTDEEAALFVGDQENFLNRLSQSIAPEIFGHDTLKVALLLLLVGGVDKNPNGMHIRGNINICLMGDPGVAKSQLLSFIDRLASRSQYTTGRGSSGVGLTAAVMKDPITGEMTLEGGALVLADQGICCIDEFDKMIDSDRTSIHEVMEQQTVSIAKAGIMTTLNARVSILAAANPAFGRYNANRSITDNLQLPPALLSRFDLLWLIKDRPNEAKDLDLALFVANIHRNLNEATAKNDQSIDMKTMRRYIELCKTKNPSVPKELDQYFIDIYLKIRERKRFGSISASSRDTALFTSPRSLLAVIRLSTAFARLRLSEVVDKNDIDAAINLYENSRSSIEDAVGAASLSQEVLKLLRQTIDDNQSGDDTYSLKKFLDQCVRQGLLRDKVLLALEDLLRVEAVSVDKENDEITVIG